MSKEIDSFIGETFTTTSGSTLTVVCDSGRRYNKGKGGKLYTVVCSKCSLDTELFSNGFQSTKGDLKRGRVPCGCAKVVRWSQQQYTTLLTRIALERNEKFLGWLEGTWQGCAKTQVKFSCDVGHEYQTTIHSYKNKGSSCPRCSGKSSLQAKLNFEASVLQRGDCIIGNYVANNTKIKLVCKNSHEFTIKPCDYKSGYGCMACWRDSEKNPSNGKGFYPTQPTRRDTLYLLLLGNNEAIKVGRTFSDLGDKRYKAIKRGIGLPVVKYRLVEADHELIYSIEQMIVNPHKGKVYTPYENEYSKEIFKYHELEDIDNYITSCVKYYSAQILSDNYY